MAFKNAVGDKITTYCIFDSDYHSAQEQNERHAQAEERGINLHIWQRKEIENYLLDPGVIARVITQRTTKKPPTTATVQAFLLQACEEEKETVLDGIATSQDRKLGVGGANKVARELLKKHWENERLHLASGKALLSRLSAWAQKEYDVSIGAMCSAARSGTLWRDASP
jgi:hypothetical protein